MNRALIIAAMLFFEGCSCAEPLVYETARVLFRKGLDCLDEGNLRESLALFLEIYKITGASAALYNAAFVKKIMGHENPQLLDEAIADLESIVRQNPDYDDAHLSLGFAYLEKGDFKKGWEQHARYLKKSGKYAEELRTLLADNDLKDKTVLLVFEGGMGDSINFVRYAECVKKRGATVFVMVQEPLKQLFERCPFIDKVLSRSDQVPFHHATATLMSMPAVWFGQEDALPNDTPYLFPDETLVKKWRDFCDQDDRFKIGICWQADVYNDSSRLKIARRGIPLTDLLQIASDRPDIHFYSLQKKDGLEQLSQLEPNMLTVFDDSFDKEAGSFMDTAAFMMSADLIITIDSAVAHLAGALGRPVWLLLPYSSDWRWIKGRDDSPWYPSMRIFRQKAPFDWASVIKDVTNELYALV